MDSSHCDRPSGLVSTCSPRSVDATLAARQQQIAAKGIRLFALIDHAAEARAVGLAMPATVVLIFGDPLVGSPPTTAAPTIAIALPLKLLVAEDAHGAAWVSYVAPQRMKERHGIATDLATPLDAVELLVARAVA